MNLRPYQAEAVDAVFASWLDHQRSLLVAPTGSGKTVVFSHIAQRASQKQSGSGRTLILAHRDELVGQAIDKLQQSTGIRAEREQAGNHASRTAGVVVASVPSLRGPRLDSWPKDHFTHIVVDEAHHALADSYQEILARFGEAKVLGVTATPDRGDKRNLGVFFQDIAYEISLLSLIRDGYLAPIKVQTLPLPIDLNEVRTSNGDFEAGGVAQALDPYLERIADALAEDFAHRKTLVFLPLVKTSETLSALCRERGLLAEHIDGTSRDRAKILQRFSRGETRLLSNAMLLTEGYDEPSIDCVVCLRPTKIRSLYAQIVGRGTRVHPGKTELLLLDFLWISEDHSLVKPAHLISVTDTEADAIGAHLAAGDGDLIDAKEAADQDRQRALAARLAANRNRKAKLFDAMEFSVALRDLVTADFEPTMPWHLKPVSERQSYALEQSGIDPRTVRGMGHAHALIERIIERRDLKLASAKQVYWLAREGHAHPETCTFAEATVFLSKRWNRAA